MELVILNLMWALECLMIIMCLHIVNTKKFHLSLQVLGIIIINNVMFALQHYGMLPRVCAYLVYLLLFYYSYRLFKRKLLGTILRFVFGLLLSGVIELAVIIVVSFFLDLYKASAVELLVNSLISLVVSCIIYCLVFRFKKDIDFNIEDKRDILILLGFSSTAVALMVDYLIYHFMYTLQNLAIWLLCCGVFVYIIVLQKKKKEVEIRDLELEMHKLYGETYKELQSEVRKLQHDYKNQLATLDSMHLVASSLDELVEMQSEYRKELEKNSKYEQIMTCCNNSILAGYLYHKCVDFEKANMSVAYRINVLQAECRMSLHEIIEVLGILLDNAFEYLNGNVSFEKTINLEIWEDKDTLSLKVSNPAVFFTSRAISEIFKQGYSTKGSKRGIGLFRVKELVEVYNGVVS